MSKVAIIGCGFVGSTIAYTLAHTGLAREIVLIDINNDKAEGEALDIGHGIPLIKPVEIYSGSIKDVKDADVIVITAGKNRTPGKTRLELALDNVNIFKDLIPKLVAENNKAIYLIVSNPVDVLTYITCKISGLPSSKVIGSGTMLDSSRFRYLLSNELDIDARNIHGYIIGEHGDSEVATWSSTNISGIDIDDYCKMVGIKLDEDIKDKIENNIKTAGSEVINKKGATYYAISLAVIRIIECIVRDEKSILEVSSLIQGQYGIEDVSLSLPTIISSNGVERALEIKLDDEEMKSFRESAEIMKKTIKDVGF
ncbi:L-lactate dehydrogenase [Clostridium cylindrosporum]|uniref:L-lactate dehydrogenase n=1 Tax=Clostridium cylindrosporum DSM 605 TaxID=1121307 RepID=A0A0J8G042_CLOCY|nr:L-lactate dehydrogenase [Clostridium cylindrosporum]KMT21171.1 L-lactate dehydrogenase Ldh [Clostridium cylindrosporum DSM 605]